MQTMSKQSTSKVSIFMRNVPSDLRQRLIETAEERESNLNDVAVQALADALGVRYEPVGRKAATSVDTTTVALRAPASLRKKLRLKAVREGVSQQDLAIRLLREAV